MGGDASNHAPMRGRRGGGQFCSCPACGPYEPVTRADEKREIDDLAKMEDRDGE